MNPPANAHDHDHGNLGSKHDASPRLSFRRACLGLGILLSLGSGPLACDTGGAETKQLPASSPSQAPSITLRDGAKKVQESPPPKAQGGDNDAAGAGHHPPVTRSKDGQSYVGTLAPSSVVKVPAKQTGTSAELKVDEGAFVKKGQVLFRQDSTMARLQLRQGEKALAVAQIQAKAAQRELTRARKLTSGGATAQVRLDGAQTQSELAFAGVAQAEAAIALARQQITDATMRAPQSGIITQKVMEKGELATMMPPSVVYVLESHDPIEVQLSVPIAALKQIKPGQSATLRLSELGINRPAKVTRISDHVDPRTRSAQVILQAGNEDRSLKPGMYVDVQLSQSKLR